MNDLKSAAEVLRRADKIEEYEKILDAREKMLEMQDKISSLAEENNELKDKLKIKDKLHPRNDAYWLKDDGDEKGPFCTRCWDKNRNLLRLHVGDGNKAYGRCPECENSVKVWPRKDNLPKASAHKPYKNNPAI